jgi:hypothetical protein
MSSLQTQFPLCPRAGSRRPCISKADASSDFGCFHCVDSCPLNGQRLGGISFFGGYNSGPFESFACGLVSGAVGCFTAFLAVVSWYSKPLHISSP